MPTDKEKLDELLRLIEVVAASADSTGCSDDLTVVSKEAMDTLEDYVVNHYGENIFEKRRIEVTELQVWEIRIGQILSVISGLALRIGWTILGLVGLWYLLAEKLRH